MREMSLKLFKSKIVNRTFLKSFICSEAAKNPQPQTTEPSAFADVEMGKPDVILSINDAYNRDKNASKVSLGVGAYRDDCGKPWVLPSVRKAEERIMKKKMHKEYAPILGLADFHEAAAKLAFGDKSKVLHEGMNATLQTISGTGAVCVGAHFLAKFWRKNHEVFLPQPTWGNHMNIFCSAGFKVSWYCYYEPSSKSLNFEAFMDDIGKMPQGSIILLHPCAHNPTGVDPTPEQWCEISQKIKEQKLFPFFDMAYQGFATGDVDRDAFAVRLFELDGHQMCLAQSFSKNMGLYGERVGALTIVAADSLEVERLRSQLRIIVRSLYSSPPLHGARIAAEILNNSDLCKQWQHELKLMTQRITDMRHELQAILKRLGSKHSWDHLTNHIGMFCYTGLTEAQVEQLAQDFSIYMTKDGRISVTGINSNNVEYVAEAFHKVTQQLPFIENNRGCPDSQDDANKKNNCDGN